VSVLIVDALVDGHAASVRVDNGRIVEVGPELRVLDSQVLDARGGALIPGLHDHHVHLRAAAAAIRSVQVGPPSVTDRDELRDALVSASEHVESDGWLRAVGYHESVAGVLDRDQLDKLIAHVPVRLQHRSGILWILNGLAVERAGIEGIDHPGIERDTSGRPTGRLWRADQLLRPLSQLTHDELGVLSRQALSRGVIGFTEATPGQSDSALADLASARQSGAIRQHVHLMAPIGACVPEGRGISVGAVKILYDDISMPTIDSLRATVRSAHEEGRPVAVHCVTPDQLVLALAAIELAGSNGRDRIEHGSIFPRAFDDQARRLRITVVTQPHFVSERGDQYMADIPEREWNDLYRCRTLQTAGIRVAAGTDAPYGSIDPWQAIRSATARTTESGRLLGLAEQLSADDALGLFLGEPEAPERRRTVANGQPANLCVLAAPLEAIVADPDADPVLATLIDGEVLFER
jgi:predicted amidohydrolase YtcJ